MLYEAIPLEPPLHLVKADWLLLSPLGNDRKVMQVFHQTLIAPEGDDDPGLLALGINDVLLLYSFHDTISLSSSACDGATHPASLALRIAGP